MKTISGDIMKKREAEDKLVEGTPAINGTSSAYRKPAKSPYVELLRAIHELFDGKIDGDGFETRCRSLFGPSGYVIYTLDKLVQAIIRQIQAIQADRNSLDLVSLYLKDREQSTNSFQAEAQYKASARKLVEGEPLYRLEYVSGYCAFRESLGLYLQNQTSIMSYSTLRTNC
jgi:histone deacetylase complex regulatory component SIN3